MEFRNLFNDILHNLCFSSEMIKMMKSRNLYIILDVKPNGCYHLEGRSIGGRWFQVGSRRKQCVTVLSRVIKLKIQGELL
jgi:hypothetical protein